MLINCDSELMQQVLTSTSLTETKDFYVVWDKKHQPMVFSIGSGGVLYLIVQDNPGRNELVNLS